MFHCRVRLDVFKLCFYQSEQIQLRAYFDTFCNDLCIVIGSLVAHFFQFDFVELAQFSVFDERVILNNIQRAFASVETFLAQLRFVRLVVLAFFVLKSATGHVRIETLIRLHFLFHPAFSASLKIL